MRSSRGESRNDKAETDHGFAVVVEVGGVGEAVAANVGAGGVFWVGPPVVALGEEVVRASVAAFAVRGGDGDRLFGEVSVSGGKDAGAVGGGDEVVRALIFFSTGGFTGEIAGGSDGECQEFASR